MATLEVQVQQAKGDILRQAQQARTQVQTEASRALRREPGVFEVGRTVAVEGVPQAYQKEVREWQEKQLSSISQAEREAQSRLETVYQAVKATAPTYEGLTPEEEALLKQGYDVEEINRRRQLAAQREYEEALAKEERDITEKNVLVAGKWYIPKEDYAALSAEDKKLIQQVGIDQFNKMKDREYQQSLAEQAQFDVEQAQFERENVKVTIQGVEKWVDRAEWNGLTQSQQDEIRKTGQYTTIGEGKELKVLPPGFIGPPAPDEIRYEDLTSEQKAQLKETSVYVVKTPTGEQRIPAGTWEGMSLGAQLKIAKGRTPSLPEYTAEYYAMIEAEKQAQAKAGKVVKPFDPAVAEIDAAVAYSKEFGTGAGVLAILKGYPRHLMMPAISTTLEIGWGTVTTKEKWITAAGIAMWTSPLWARGAGKFYETVAQRLPIKFQTAYVQSLVTAKQAGALGKELSAATEAAKKLPATSPEYAAALTKLESVQRLSISADLKLIDSLQALKSVNVKQLATLEKAASMPGLKQSVLDVLKTGTAFEKSLKVPVQPATGIPSPKALETITARRIAYTNALDKLGGILQPRSVGWRVPLQERLVWQTEGWGETLTPAGFEIKPTTPSFQVLLDDLYGWQMKHPMVSPESRGGVATAIKPVRIIAPSFEITPKYIPGEAQALLVPGAGPTPVFWTPTMLGATSLYIPAGLLAVSQLTWPEVPEVELILGRVEVQELTEEQIERMPITEGQKQALRQQQTLTAVSPYAIPGTRVTTKGMEWVSPAQAVRQAQQQATWLSPAQMLKQFTNLQQRLGVSTATRLGLAPATTTAQQTKVAQALQTQLRTMTRAMTQLRTMNQVTPKTAVRTAIGTTVLTRVPITPVFRVPFKFLLPIPGGVSKRRAPKKLKFEEERIAEPYSGVYPGLVLHFPTPLEEVKEPLRPRPVIKKRRIPLRKKGTYPVAGFRELR